MTTLFAGIFVILFLVVIAAALLGFRFLEVQRKKQVEEVLTAVSGPQQGPLETTILRDIQHDDAFSALLKRTHFSDRIPAYIQQAGLDWNVTQVIASMIILGVVGALLGFLIRPLGFLTLSMLAGACLLGGIPYWLLLHKRRKRMELIEDQLPEALDFLARSMKAGHAFSISLEMMGGELPEPLGAEFRTLFNELNLGAPLENALASFAIRIPLLDVRLFISSVMLQRQTGGNLSEILVRLAYVIRERFRLRGQVRAASAHGRMTAGVLTALPLVLLLALLWIAPDYLRMMANDSDGKWMIVGAIIAQAMGYFVMRKITNIKV